MTIGPVFGLAFGSSVVGTLMSRYAAIGLRFVSHPNPIVKQHKWPVAYLGGVGVFLGYLAGISCLRTESPVAVLAGMRRFALPAFLFLALGICDDRKAFSAPPKFGLQVVVALIAVLLGNRFVVPGSSFAGVFLSTLWIVTLVNAYNMIDVCDGLAAGISAIALAALSFENAAGGTHPIAACGAALGFLVFNFPPASIFLGDAGSHLLGFLIASFSMTLFGGRGPWPYGPEVMLISGIPLFELVFITVIRLRKGLPWWRGSPDHFALRLQAAGLSRLQTDLCGWFAAALMAIAGLSLKYFSPAASALCLVVALLTLFGSAQLLQRFDSP
jgi:UDP-GlcNAc:undecaprenyl-phosphate GlcNAc-1-phosphate transferase